MTKSFDFYFDFASPYGYLASRKVGRSPQPSGVT